MSEAKFTAKIKGKRKRSQHKAEQVSSNTQRTTQLGRAPMLKASLDRSNSNSEAWLRLTCTRQASLREANDVCFASGPALNVRHSKTGRYPSTLDTKSARNSCQQHSNAECQDKLNKLRQHCLRSPRTEVSKSRQQQEVVPGGIQDTQRRLSK